MREIKSLSTLYNALSSLALKSSRLSALEPRGNQTTLQRAIRPRTHKQRFHQRVIHKTKTGRHEWREECGENFAKTSLFSFIFSLLSFFFVKTESTLGHVVVAIGREREKHHSPMYFIHMSITTTTTAMPSNVT